MLASETVPSRFNVAPQKGACEDVLIPELDRLCVWGGPVFANFDGFGVDTPHQLVQRVGKAKAPEVLITFQAQWFTRFAIKPEYEAGDKVFGDQEWRAVADLPTPEKKRFLVDEYRERLTRWGFPLHLTFELVDEKGNDLFLVFGTANPRGMEKMKDRDVAGGPSNWVPIPGPSGPQPDEVRPIGQQSELGTPASADPCRTRARANVDGGHPKLHTG